MTLFYPSPAHSSNLLYGMRVLFGSAMVLSILLGFAAICQGDVRGHRAWMAPAYAIGLGAGTQVLTLMIGELIAGPPDELGNALLMGAGWVINLAGAEWIIKTKTDNHERPQSSLDYQTPGKFAATWRLFTGTMEQSPHRTD